MVRTGRLLATVALVATCAVGWWSGAQTAPHASTAAEASAASATAPPTPPPGTTCTWGGTVDNPTGTFTITPGLTNNPSTAPSRFYVTGDLSGDPGCDGTLTYIGQIDAGGT